MSSTRVATPADLIDLVGKPPSVIRTVTVGKREIRVDVRRGDGIRMPLLMCCGIGASFEVLQPLVDALDPGIEVIRFDVPGAGGSPVGTLPYLFPQLAWLLSGMLDELGYRQVDVLGFSWGGALAQQFAAQHRRRCRRLVLVSTGTGALMVPGKPWVLARMVSPRRFRDPEYAASMAGLLYGGSARTHANDVLRLFRDHMLTGSRRGYVYQLAAGAVWTSLPFLKLIRQPTLVMGGDDDPIVPLVNARIMARLIPKATLHVFTGGHVEPVTRASEVGPVISHFLDEEPS
jgi:poly(3-hydroxyalkanoate) depolymerase